MLTSCGFAASNYYNRSSSRCSAVPFQEERGWVSETDRNQPATDRCRT